MAERKVVYFNLRGFEVVYKHEGCLIFDINILPLPLTMHTKMTLLDWVGNQPTRCRFMPQSEAVEQLHTKVPQVSYPLE